MQDAFLCLSTLVIEPRRTIADMLVRALQSSPQITPLGPATNVREGVVLARTDQPHSILVGLDAVFSTLAEFTHQHSVGFAESRILLLGDDYSDMQLEMLLKSGVDGILTTDQPLEALMDCLIAAGENGDGVALAPRLWERVEYDEQRQRFTVKRSRELPNLTLRQLDVLKELARGESVKDVARRMYLSARSVESHKYRLMRRLRLNNRVELCRFAIREGLIDA